MGKGKGAVDHWVAVVKTGRIIFEVGGLPEEAARDALRLAGFKFGLKTRMIAKLGSTGATE
jgi:large subunit ribosomal protein L16